MLFLVLSCSSVVPVHAQDDQRDQSIARLPRPGYEPHTIRLGSAMLQPSLEAGATYNNNIFATRTDRVSDTIFNVTPRLTLQRQSPSLNLDAEVSGDFIRYASNSRENVNNFGGKLDVVKPLTRTQSIAADVSFQRTFERRSDPEADVDRALAPALINLLTGGLRYRYQGGRVGLIAAVQASELDYLPAADADRDLRTYRASLRALTRISDGMSLFVEHFINRRDARLPFDRTGVDRDTTTIGGLGGVSFDLADKLQGELGFGAFRANPDDKRLKNFTGLAASGRLIWRPRVRTAVTLEMFRGDVMTIRSGAIGRIDSRVSLAIDQEARHNLILRGSVGLQEIHYRGTIDRDQRFTTVQTEARYLLNRHMSLVVGGSYTHRGADLRDERFARWQGTAGIRYAY